MSVKITSLEVENVKRVKAVQLAPSENGLTIIGGNNGQGKTSVLDSIAWALGGDRFAPSAPKREGSMVPPHLTVRLNNGIVVERKGKNSDLKVIDPSGKKRGQTLLNSFISQFALDLPRFMNANNKEKADTLLRVIGVGDKLYALEDKEARLYNERLAIGRIRDQKSQFAKELPDYPDAPAEPVSASELIKKQQEILAQNGENRRLREQKDKIEERANALQTEITRLSAELTGVLAQLEIARKTVAELHDESTAELERSIAQFEQINVQVRANLDREKAMDEATALWEEYNHMSVQLDELRQAKIDLLKGANLPLPELGVEDGELVYRGQKWDCMSASEQLRVATAFVRALKPDCGFVLIDKLEQMDLDTLRDFGAWLEQEGLQGIATRVSTGEECSILIEDGYAKNAPEPASKQPAAKQWKAGEF